MVSQSNVRVNAHDFCSECIDTHNRNPLTYFSKLNNDEPIKAEDDQQSIKVQNSVDMKIESGNVSNVSQIGIFTT